MLGVPLGSAVSFAVSGAAAEAWGWRAAMAIAAAPALLLIPALLALEEPKRGASETAHSIAPVGAAPPQPVQEEPAWRLLRIPTLRWIVLSGALINFNLYAVASFLPAFMIRFHGLTVAEAGWLTGIGHAVAGVAGGLLGGMIGDWVIRRRSDGRMLAAALTALAAAPAAWFGVLMPSGSALATMTLLMVAYGLLQTYYGLVYSAIQDIVPPERRGSAMAIYFLAMYLCGASFGPLLTGRLSDYFALRAAAASGSSVLTEAARASGLQSAMHVIPVLSLALAAVLYCGSRTIREDRPQRPLPRAAVLKNPGAGLGE
jgi:MFS family permease